MFVEQRSLKISAGAHIGALLLALFGLPVLLPEAPEPKPLVMTVEVLPISEITNVKPSDKPIQDAKKAPTVMKKPTPPKPVAAQPKPTPKEDKPEPVEKTFDPDAEKVEVEKKKPIESKPTEKPKDEKTLEQILADLEKESKTSEKDAKDTVTQEENKTKSEAPYDATQPLSLSEEDALKNAYIPCWSPPAGAKDAANLIVVLRAQYNPDGSLIDAKLDSSLQGRYNSDTFFRAAADSAMRAVKHPRCNPLKNLPASLFPKLKDTKITFDPRSMM